MTSIAKTPAAPSFLKTRLSVMMFLQYAIWGAWLPLLFPFLLNHRKLTPEQIGHMFAVGALGSIFAPFIAGQIADRWFATQKFLGISHVLGAVLVWQLATIDTYWGFLAFSLVYSLIYSPTLSLTNSISFHHLPDRDRDFGKVRWWGTLGWICVGIGVGQWLLLNWTPSKVEPAPGVTTRMIYEDPSANIPKAIEGNSRQLADVLENDLIGKAKVAAVTKALKDANKQVPTTKVEGKDVVDLEASLAALGWTGEQQTDHFVTSLGESIEQRSQQKGMHQAFQVSAVLGLLLGLYCFTLPNTPPSKERKDNATFAAMGEVKKNPLITLFLIAVPVSCIHQFYFVHTGGFLGQFQSETASEINKIFGVGGGGLMTVGQMAEILVLLAMPIVAKQFSRKTLLAVGLMAYAARMALFAYVDPIATSTGVAPVAILITGVAMHGLCFGCFIFVAFMIVDEETTKDVRASAQSLFGLVVFGIRRAAHY